MAESTIIGIHNLVTRHQLADISPSFSSAQLYDSLRVDQGCIRVLDLEPEPVLPPLSGQSVDSPLRGTLRVVSMKDCPEFSALSYVWGSKADPPDILVCNGCKIEITSNCKDALQAVRKSQGGVTIWVDAICINQKDNLDKASQIPNMEDIYTWATMVYVWLGRGDEHTDCNMKNLRWASRYSLCLTGNRIRHTNCGLAGRRDPRDLWTLCTKDLKDFWALIKFNTHLNNYARLIMTVVPRKRRWYPEAFDGLLSRPWISRAWTFQELVLAQDITIMCGEQSLSWDHFIRGMWIVACNYEYEISGILLGIIEYALLPFWILIWLVAYANYYPTQAAFGYRKERDISATDEVTRVLLQVTKYRSATEPRDRVYAAYGILRSFNIQLSAIDYTKGEDQVFLDFFFDLLRSSPNYLIFIVDAGLSDDTAFPSWVPKWKTTLERPWLPPDVYSSPIREAAIGSPHAQLIGKSLQVMSMIFYEVGFITETFKIKYVEGDELPGKFENPVATLCELIDQAGDLSFNHTYQSIIQSIFQAINPVQPGSDQPAEFYNFLSLYEKIRAELRGGGDAQVDYMATTRAVLKQHFHTLEHEVLADLFNTFANRCLFKTVSGYLGSGPSGIKPGDLVAHVAGVPVPMIFRETGILDTYHVVGSAFVLGLMEREDSTNLNFREVTLV
ncbi:heterokaryon incompatibility protein-domain-containing protein [Xylaria cubensis]|nr:heterokaryon incompatibility protein-domain-containing protein [Xylaria cubensis]